MSKYVRIPESAPIHLPGAVPKGKPADDDRLQVTIVLKSSKPSNELIKKLKEIEYKLPLSRPRLSPEDIEEIHAAEANHVRHVKQFAKQHGLKVVDESKVRHEVVLEGSVSALNAAFKVELRHFQHSEGVYVAHEGPIHVPKELECCIVAVIGLDDVPVAEALAGSVIPEQIGMIEEPARRMVGTDPRVIAKEHYNFPLTDLDGTGQRIAIISFGGGYHDQDIEWYFKKTLGLRKWPKVTTILVSGPGNRPTPIRKLGRLIDDLNNANRMKSVEEDEDCGVCMGRMWATYETTMDIEIAGAIAPGAEIDVYFAENTMQGYLAAFNAALGMDGKPPASVVSVSWGKGECWPGPSFKQAINLALKQGVRDQSVTVCCASGDFGSVGVVPDCGYDDSANVSFPASSPWVLACGGTTLGLDGDESVWNANWKGQYMATGGGVSGFFERRSWQEDHDVPRHGSYDEGALWLSEEVPNSNQLEGGWIEPDQKNFRGRGVPDIAANADPANGYKLYVGGRETVGGGTSASAPLWAGLIALINQGLSKKAVELEIAGPVQLGFVNKLFYRTDIASAFRSITRGCNRMPDYGSSAAAFEAREGWDACTGLGVPDGTKLLEVLGRLEDGEARP